MGMNIKNERTQRLTRDLAQRTGESLTAAITVAVEERLARLDAGDADRVEDLAERILAIGRDAAARWVEPHRSADHGDLLYDDRGLPR